jgi:hypothetical protein
MADEAIARAKELDEYYKKTGKLVGPLVKKDHVRNAQYMTDNL